MDSQGNRSGQAQNYLQPLANNQTLSVHSSTGVDSSDGAPQNTAMVSAELHLVALKDSFKQAANSLTQLYK